MKILLINKYLYPKGGDAISTLATGRLLAEKGHDVVFWGMKHPANPAYPYSEYFLENIDYDEALSIKQKLSAFFKIMYSLEAKSKIERLVNIIKPDIAHLNNFAHQISPSILHVFRKHKIPVVMTMHDYKIVCPSYSMLADGRPCESCKESRYYYCVIKKCVKNSYVKSTVNTLEMYLHHRILHIYDLIDLYISPSVFLKEKVKEMGFKKEIVYLPNFIDLDGFIPDYTYKNKICYFGRLSHEKGIGTLLQAVAGLDIELKIIGSGPLEERLRQKVINERIRNIKFLGYKTGDDLWNKIKGSMATVIPSQGYENNPRTILESFALGMPVVGARIGGIPELVTDAQTGYTYEAGNADDLRNKILKLSENKDRAKEMGKNARSFVEENFGSEKHYVKLMDIYSKAIGEHRWKRQ